jgi:hypothetical protein
VSLRPRHVVLPVRLIVRHSCGSQLTAEGQCPLSLPIPRNGLVAGTMVKPLSPEERLGLSQRMVGLATPAPISDHDKADVNRLLQVLRHQEADRVPHLEFRVTSKAVYEYVLERELDGDGTGTRLGGQAITPEDHVDFALRLGMDAVSCHFRGRPRNADLDDLEPPPSLADQLSLLERYLRAARGTGVGVMASFTSFFDSALRASTIPAHGFQEAQPQLEQLMDVLLDTQERVMRVVCDRFAGDLALVMVNDRIANNDGLRIDLETFLEVFAPRMRRLIAPAQEHGKLLLMHTPGRMDQILPILYDIGFDAVHPFEPECNDLVAIKRQWAGKLALAGGIPTALLTHGSREEIEDTVREYCIRLAPGGGYLFGSSDGITDEIPPQNLVAMTRAVHKYGRYGALGVET